MESFRLECKEQFLLMKAGLSVETVEALGQSSLKGQVPIGIEDLEHSLPR